MSERIGFFCLAVFFWEEKSKFSPSEVQLFLPLSGLGLRPLRATQPDKLIWWFTRLMNPLFAWSNWYFYQKLNHLRNFVSLRLNSLLTGLCIASCLVGYGGSVRRKQYNLLEKKGPPCFLVNLPKWTNGLLSPPPDKYRWLSKARRRNKAFKTHRPCLISLPGIGKWFFAMQWPCADFVSASLVILVHLSSKEGLRTHVRKGSILCGLNTVICLLLSRISVLLMMVKDITAVDGLFYR